MERVGFAKNLRAAPWEGGISRRIPNYLEPGNKTMALMKMFALIDE
jgi:hypothetical protein